VGVILMMISQFKLLLMSMKSGAFEGCTNPQSPALGDFVLKQDSVETQPGLVCALD